MTARAIDSDHCDGLAKRAAVGDAKAQGELLQYLWPFWIDMVRSSRSLGRLARSDDAVHEVVTRLVEKIGKAEGVALRLYPPWCERNQGKTFADWMRIVAKNVVRDYVREQLGPLPTVPGEVSVKRLLNEFATSLSVSTREGSSSLEPGVRPPFTAAQTARELVEFARRQLPADQLGVLGAWLDGGSFDEIADQFGVTADDARRLMRAAVATLRRQFVAVA